MSAGAIAGSSGNSVTDSLGAFGKLSSEDFVKVMIQELANQDPFQPQDSSALLEQLSSLRNIESQLSLEKSIGALVLQNQVASAGGMIGKLVAGVDDTNTSVQGMVRSVRIVNDKVMLELDNAQTLAMDRVLEISNMQ